MSVTFIVRTTKKEGPVTLYARVQARVPQVNLRVSTPIQIDYKLWNASPDSAIWKAFMKTPEYDLYMDMRRGIEKGVEFILKKGEGISKEQLENLIHDVCYKDQIAEEKKKEEEAAAAEAEKNRVTFKKYRDKYLEEIKNGGRSTYTGKNFAKGTIVAISVSLNRLKDFEEERKKEVDFADINMEFYRDFTAFLKKKGYGLNTLGKTIKVIKTVLKCAEEDGYHSNHTYLASSFKAPKFDADAIYLTKEELDKINKVDLSNKCWGMQAARDIFMVGVWTAQRVSDYNNIQPEDIRRETIRSWDEDGNLQERHVRTIHIVQQKTGKRVVIPCNKALRTILDKYPEGLPHLSDQKINDYIKEIGEMAKIDDLVEIRSTSGGVTKKETFKKYKLIHTHTARRTGATLMYLSGMNVYDILKITGHSNIKTLEKYIKANELETVKKITESYDYFK